MTTKPEPPPYYSEGVTVAFCFTATRKVLGLKIGDRKIELRHTLASRADAAEEQHPMKRAIPVAAGAYSVYLGRGACTVGGTRFLYADGVTLTDEELLQADLWTEAW